MRVRRFSCSFTMLGRIKRPRTKDIANIGFAVSIAFLPFALAVAQEFSADMTSRAADGKVSKIKLYRNAEKERLDLIVESQPGKTIDTHMIFDWRERMIYLVEPAQKTILINHALQATAGQHIGGWVGKL